MELRQVRYFVAVAETLNFRQASNRLHVSQPSLSVQIKQLEDELGVSLLQRSKRLVEITPAGKVFLSAAREVLLKLKQASAAALHAESGEAGTIRLGFIPTASFHILPLLLGKIRNTLPLVNVELKEGPEAAQISGIQSGEFDISLGHLGRSYDRIESMLLIREPLVVALPKGHNAAHKKTVGMKDFEGELFMIPSKDLFPSLHQLIAVAFVQNHTPLKNYQMVEHFETAVVHGPCRICVPSVLGKKHSSQGCRFAPSEFFNLPIGHFRFMVTRQCRSACSARTQSSQGNQERLRSTLIALVVPPLIVKTILDCELPSMKTFPGWLVNSQLTEAVF